MTSTINANTSGGLISTGDTSGVLALQTGGTTAVTIDASQNVGIGTGSPSAKLDISGTTTSDVYRLRSNQSAPASTDAFVYRPADNTLGFGTASAERMRLDSSGNLGVGTTSPAYKFNVVSSSDAILSQIQSTATANSTALRFGIDTNTCYINATGNSAGILQLRSYGTTAITIDSAQNVGVGVTPSAWSTAGGSVLQIKNSALWAYGSSNNIYVGANYYYNGTNRIYLTANPAAEYMQGNGAHVWYTAPSGTAGTAITFTQAMTLDASGNLGIGTTSPSRRLQVYSGIDGISAGISGSTYGIRFDNGGTYSSGKSTIHGVDTTLTGSYQPIMLNGSDVRFGISATEVGRFEASTGCLLVGTTSSSGYGGLITASAATSAFNLMTLRDTGTTYGSGQVYALFQNSGGSTAGSIQHTASTTVNYATSSDARLKTSLGVATDTSVIDNTIIHDFEWIEDGRIDRGVFAQEANEVKPSAVSVGKDDLTEEGKLVSPWGVDYSKYVPDLIVHAQQMKKLIQEQQAIIAQQSLAIQTLTSRIEALENK